MTVVWIVGSSGLLGSALRRALHRPGVRIFQPSDPFCWAKEPELVLQLRAAVQGFSGSLGTEKSWHIYWAAGVGTMSSGEAELAVETRMLSKLLSLVQSEPALTTANGCFTLASSAGAIYAGATDHIINESTPVAPTTAYAREKLIQENLAGELALSSRTVTVLLARISTLYGPGQDTGKQQGLLALIARHMLRNQPIQIYVPFDTIRDYITADDAAAAIVTASQWIEGQTGIFTRIIASEKATTIAEIISIYKRIARRTPRIVTSASKLSSNYSRSIQFRSTAPPVNSEIPRTNLFVGIAQLMAAERSVFLRSSKIESQKRSSNV
jgi:UDP-glucose 4-epimerase